MGDRFTFHTEPHGSGGFAKVIKGRDNALERDIAVKVLDPLTSGQPVGAATVELSSNKHALNYRIDGIGEEAVFCY
jgi:hypothetical protein